MSETAAPTLPDIWIEATPDSEVALDPPYRVLIHNDDVTPMEFVVVILMGIFFLSFQEANGIMLTAHYEGVAYVMTLPLEEAKYRVGKAHSIAQMEGYPLTFSIEPENS